MAPDAIASQPARKPAGVALAGSRPRTLVLGLGNPLRGDDGVATAVLEALRQTVAAWPHVAVMDGGTPGLETSLLWEGYSRVIIVDAADMGCPPGAWQRLTLDAVQLSRGTTLHGTLHAAGLAEALELAAALERLPAELVIYGVQPQEIGWRPGLSAAVASAVPAVCAAIVDEIGM